MFSKITGYSFHDSSRNIAETMVHALRPVQSITQLAIGALYCLITPVVGPSGWLNGFQGIINGSINSTQDLVEASCTVSHIATNTPVTISEVAHLTVSCGMLTLVMCTVMNPLMALLTAKTSAMFISKSLFIGVGLL